jgi:hypothetical protein
MMRCGITPSVLISRVLTTRCLKPIRSCSNSWRAMPSTLARPMKLAVSMSPRKHSTVPPAGSYLAVLAGDFPILDGTQLPASAVLDRAQAREEARERQREKTEKAEAGKG